MSQTAAHEWSLWSTTARLVVTDPGRLLPALHTARAVLSEVDAAANRFDPLSEISRLPAQGGTTTLSPMLAALVRESLDAARDTEGVVDPTVGRALVDLGYDRDISLVLEGDRPVARVRRVAGWRAVRLSGSELTLPPGVLLDLGATAKASAADRVAAAVHREHGTGVLMSLGGDIATAGVSPEDGWQVHVQDTDADPSDAVALPAGAGLATSSTVRRAWTTGGRRVHHLLDPATGEPAPRTWRSATVAAPTALAANIASTAVVVLGERAPAWLVAHDLDARLVDTGGRVHRFGGWPTSAAA
ncbi:FAD:protein FMN transferase [Nocardioides acrostichi]|uniref:FAD:protein FMN transferase n=1 Tax=Nocardioides acrostichi TaxID=2784339 RepID=A0A930UXZ3_9ACTN|nr:FAD:protein FMN transferase [Nocardioides acrostichi]MBF4162943.1 FAD:protein FMN transferase [Nocardioides acrostichi]